MTQIGNTYAAGLYSLAKEEDLSGQILEQLTALDAAFSREPDYLRLLAAPNLSKEERCDILDEGFRGKVHPYVLNFMKLLTQKGYIRHFSDCCHAYREQYHDDHGILPVCAVSAVPLTAEQTAKLQKKLEAITGKAVELTNRVDPAVLGGVRLDYSGRRVDGTVQNRLDAVRQLLKNTVL